MPGIGNRNLRRTAAIVVACALILQSLTIAFAFSGGAAQVRFDQFGNPICNNLLDHGDGGTGGSPHGKLPPCCLFGCSMFVPLLTAPSASVPTEAPWANARRVLFPALPRIYIRAAAYDSGNPRAPPVI